MKSCDDGNFVEIQPKTKILSSDELISLRHVKIETTKLGQKRMSPKNTEDESLELQKAYDNLRQQLSAQRIDCLGARCLAEWDAGEEAVRVVRKDSKFGYFGYNRNGIHYLEHFEALFLLELGRLQLEYNSMIISIEQAYLLLLGENSSSKFNEYLVYSHLSRIGFIPVKHQNIRYEDQVEQTLNNCVWELTLSAIQHKSIPKHIKNSCYYGKAKEDLDHLKNCIIQQQQPKIDEQLTTKETEINFNGKVIPNKKRSSNEVTDDQYEMKRRRLSAITNKHKSYIDYLKDETEYKKFQSIFQSFDIVELNVSPPSDVNCRCLSIKFDLYLHNKGFKKSQPTPPIFRLIILNENEPFPTHAEIYICQQQQQYQLPLLVLSINESKQIQAFCYYIS